MAKIILREKIYIPIHDIDDHKDTCDAHFVVDLFNEEQCEPCEERDDRPNDVCMDCANYLARKKLYNHRTVDDQEYIGVPYGKKNILPKLFPFIRDLGIKDMRPEIPFKSKLRFTGTPRPAQKLALKELFQYAEEDRLRGILVAPARSGKCVVGDSIVQTREGFVNIDSLFPQDFKSGEERPLSMRVMTKDGWKMTEAMYAKYVDHTWSLRTYYGHTVRGTPQHPVYTVNPDTLELVYKELQDIVEGDYIVSIPTHWGDNFSGVTPEEARLLGYFTANGNLTELASGSSRFSFCSNDKRVQKDFLKCLKSVTGTVTQFTQHKGKVWTVVLTDRKVSNTLYNLGLDFVASADKQVPTSVMSGGYQGISNFLNAYLSCDSTIKTSNEGLELCTASRKLLKQIHTLLSAVNCFGKVSSSVVNIQRGPTRYWRMLLNSMSADTLFKTIGRMIAPPLRTDHNYVKGWQPALPESATAFVVSMYDNKYDASSKAFLANGKSYLVQSKKHKVWGALYPNGKCDLVRRNRARRNGSTLVEMTLDMAKRINWPLLNKLDETRCNNLKHLVSKLKSGWRFHRVTSCKPVNKPSWVYDLSVPDGHNYMANGVVVHNTPSGIALACGLQLRTLILANTHDLCQQFYYTCVGGEGYEPLTNAPILEKKYGKQVVVLADKLEDFYKGDIVISTYQKFISEVGKERLKKIANKFSLLLVDEVHRANSDSFLKVVANLNTIHKLGLTATVTRKDGMDVLNQYVLGKVLHRMKIDTLQPKIVFHETDLFPKKDYSMWVYYQRWLERDTERTALILEQVMKDLKAKRSLVIPCTFTSQVHELVRRINYMYGRNIAVAITGGSTKAQKAQRTDALERARQGKVRCVVGIRSIISTGINVPAWDTLYVINWQSNPPQWIQEYSRILTPLEGKDPIIRMWLDGSGQTRGCLRTCLFKTEGTTPPLSRHARISPEQWAIANAYLRRGKMDGRVAKNVERVITKKGRLAL